MQSSEGMMFDGRVWAKVLWCGEKWWVRTKDGEMEEGGERWSADGGQVSHQDTEQGQDRTGDRAGLEPLVEPLVEGTRHVKVVC